MAEELQKTGGRKKKTLVKKAGVEKPRKSKGLKKQYAFRTTQAFAQYLREKIAASGHTESEFFRRAMIGDETEIVESNNHKQRALLLLSKTSNNVNQIGRVLNDELLESGITMRDYEKALDNLVGLVEGMKSLSAIASGPSAGKRKQVAGGDVAFSVGDGGFPAMFGFRVTEADAKFWDEKIAESGCSKSEFFRRLSAKNKAQVFEVADNVKRAVLLMSKVSNVINMTARKMNSERLEGSVNKNTLVDALMYFGHISDYLKTVAKNAG